MSRSNRVGASKEVLRHHGNSHPCPPGVPRKELVCPCFSTRLLCCGHCDQPVFLVVAPGTWCDHVQEYAP